MRDGRGRAGAAQERVAGRVGTTAPPVRTRRPRVVVIQWDAVVPTAEAQCHQGAAAAFLLAVTSYGDPGDDPPMPQSGGAPILLQTAD
jgi:hypothetical protein